MNYDANKVFMNLMTAVSQLRSACRELLAAIRLKPLDPP